MPFQIVKGPIALPPHLKTVRKTKHNTVYYDKDNGLYYKIYRKHHDKEYSKFLIDLLSNKKFRKTFCPCLKALIVAGSATGGHHQTPQNCDLLGYITKAGRLFTRNDLVSYLQNKATQTMWKHAISKYHFVYNDFKTTNLIWTKKNRASLIDLDALRPYNGTRKLTRGPNVRRKIALFGLGWYYNYLDSLVKSI